MGTVFILPAIFALLVGGAVVIADGVKALMETDFSGPGHERTVGDEAHDQAGHG